VLSLRSELAKKSKAILIYAVIGESLLIITLLYITSTYGFKYSNMPQDDRIVLFIFGASAILYFFWALSLILVPTIRIEYNEKGIFIKNFLNREHYIAFKDIIEVDSRFSRSKYMKIKKSGKLIVSTKEKNHTIYNLEDIEQVKIELQKQVSKHKIDSEF